MTRSTRTPRGSSSWLVVSCRFSPQLWSRLIWLFGCVSVLAWCALLVSHCRAKAGRAVLYSLCDTVASADVATPDPCLGIVARTNAACPRPANTRVSQSTATQEFELLLGSAAWAESLAEHVRQLFSNNEYKVNRPSEGARSEAFRFKYDLDTATGWKKELGRGAFGHVYSASTARRAALQRGLHCSPASQARPALGLVRHVASLRQPSCPWQLARRFTAPNSAALLPLVCRLPLGCR